MYFIFSRWTATGCPTTMRHILKLICFWCIGFWVVNQQLKSQSCIQIYFNVIFSSMLARLFKMVLLKRGVFCVLQFFHWLSSNHELSFSTWRTCCIRINKKWPYFDVFHVQYGVPVPSWKVSLRLQHHHLTIWMQSNFKALISMVCRFCGS